MILTWISMSFILAFIEVTPAFMIFPGSFAVGMSRQDNECIINVDNKKKQQTIGSAES